jgi:hypothetical protein
VDQTNQEINSNGQQWVLVQVLGQTATTTTNPVSTITMLKIYTTDEMHITLIYHLSTK